MSDTYSEYVAENSDVLNAKNTFTQQLTISFNKYSKITDKCQKAYNNRIFSPVFVIISLSTHLTPLCDFSKNLEREKEDSNVFGEIFFLTSWPNKEKKKN